MGWTFSMHARNKIAAKNFSLNPLESDHVGIMRTYEKYISKEMKWYRG
jgi:hypothetical protein